MEGAAERAHARGRASNGVVSGNRGEAASMRQRAQQGAAAAGRIGQAIEARRSMESAFAQTNAEDVAIRKEVSRAMQQGAALVQAALEQRRSVLGRSG